MRPKIDFNLYLITDRKAADAGRILDVIDAACASGVGAVQVREKDLASAPLFDLVTKLKVITARHGSRLLVNDRYDIAQFSGADGVHLSEAGVSAGVVRAQSPDVLIGVSTHHIESAKKAQSDGADFVTFGPVFNTPSKAAYGPPQGLESLRAVCDAVAIPVFALGGVTPSNARSCVSAGARGVACISAILSAPDPGAAVKAFLNEL